MFCSVILGNFYFYNNINLSRTSVVGSRVPLLVSTLYLIPDYGKLQFQFMFLL